MVMIDVRNMELYLGKQGCENYTNASSNIIWATKTNYVNTISILLITVTDMSTSQV
jgi:hypothetical protein